MGELRGMIPIEALQFPQSYEANFKLKRTYHVKRERTRNRSEAGSKYYLRSSSDFDICESQAGQPSASWNMEIKEHNDSSPAADLVGKSEVARSKSRSIDDNFNEHSGEDYLISVTNVDEDKGNEGNEGNECSGNDFSLNLEDDYEDKLQREDWWQDFDLLLHHPVGIRLFTEFLTKEFSQENIIFWKSCQQYKKISDNKVRVSKAEEIFAQHLAAEAPEPVNVDSGARQTASEAVKTAIASRCGNPDMFNTSQKQIYNLMKMDSYQRFLQSNIFKDYIEKEREESRFENYSGVKQGKKNKQDNKKWSLSNWSNIIGRPKSKEREPDLPGLTTRTFSSPNIALLAQTCPDIEFTRILLPDGSTAILSSKSGETLEEMIQTLLRRRGERREVKP
ncbi:regulator of G-protein signaling loco isoform X3 [Eurytemora carolleeae]|uniref:regulator of G-protein signaling loco isoform X3 n=1 Tax=Eurytemora carolleeae TaxID=1294199 RepID=UPI000C761419|nr:regulator of G-protein signaling loco isoform X3 [Eurytemora carolleeae]|eukprot:XP_023343104.1 regulator of G-protein signaling loco-like isoform X3 [Eurytemora affinis]